MPRGIYYLQKRKRLNQNSNKNIKRNTTNYNHAKRNLLFTKKKKIKSKFK